MNRILQFLVIYLLVAMVVVILFAKAPTTHVDVSPEQVVVEDEQPVPPSPDEPFAISKVVSLTKDSTASGHDITELKEGNMRINVSCTEPITVLLFNASYYDDWLSWNEQKIPFSIREKHASKLEREAVTTTNDDIIVLDASESDVWSGAWKINCTLDVDSTT